MRQFKFKAWDRKKEKMFPVHELKFSQIDQNLMYLRGYDAYDKDSDFNTTVFYGGNTDKKTGNPLKPRFELMQYTGLKDKNGADIYEGDILRITDDGEITNNSDTGIGIVEYLEKWGEWYVTGPSGIQGPQNSLGELNYVYEIEVIGNIYSNPEPLEVSE